MLLHKRPYSIVYCETLQYLYVIRNYAVYEIFQRTRPRAKFTNEFEHFVTTSFFLSWNQSAVCRPMDRARQRTETAIDSPFGRNVNRQAVLPNRGHFVLVESLAQYFSHVPLFNDIQYVRRTAQILCDRLTFMNTSITACDSCNISVRELARDATAIKISAENCGYRT